MRKFSQILFEFTIEYVLVRKKFFYEKSVKVSFFFAERKDKWLTYNKIEEWYILDYLTRSIMEVSLIW